MFKSSNTFLNVALGLCLATVNADWINPNYHGQIPHGRISGTTQMQNYGIILIKDIMAKLDELCPPTDGYNYCSTAPFSMKTTVAENNVAYGAEVVCSANGAYHYPHRKGLLEVFETKIGAMVVHDRQEVHRCFPVGGPEQPCESHMYLNQHFPQSVNVGITGQGGVTSFMEMSCNIEFDSSESFCTVATAVGSAVGYDVAPIFTLSGLYCDT